MLNPIVGVGSYDTGMYAYTIIRSAIEWAFQAANLPIIKRSPWPYAYDAALIIRHDFENYLSYLNGTIESSAQYERSVGAKGDYYFCTGILRTLTTDAEKQPYIDSMKRAVSLDGATIGSHNGGLPNIGVGVIQDLTTTGTGVRTPTGTEISKRLSIPLHGYTNCWL